MTAKIPFDDRRNYESNLNDIDLILVKSFLNDVRSGIVFEQNIDSSEILKKMRLVVPSNSRLIPRNIALLFFNEHPENFFPCAKIEIAQFRDDSGGDLIEEKTITGPLHYQIKKALEYLNNIGEVKVQKIPGQAEVERTVAYPYEAMEEAVVNAIFHRGYDSPPEPIKIYLYPTRMEITSYPGPVDGINLEHFQPNNKIPDVPYRNRRIGDFLKDLRLAEKRGTGIPKIRRKMEENGSPAPIFRFDEKARNYFTVILPVHPKYIALHSFREAAHLWATGEKTSAIQHLKRAVDLQPFNGLLVSQILDYIISEGQFEEANRVIMNFHSSNNKT
jgi:ATP-dependent DNA helicase RecG